MFLDIYVSAKTESKASSTWQTYYLLRDCKESPLNTSKQRHEAYQPSVASWLPKQNPRLHVDLSHGGAAIIELFPSSHSSSSLSSSYNSRLETAILACEIFIQAPPGLMIMLQIRNLFIPTPSTSEDLCDENYLYLFDSNTPRFRAMPEAGGEKGLCQEVNDLGPIFSSSSYLTAVFRSSLASVNGRRAGFQFLLTAVAFTTNDGVCPPTAANKGYSFHCGNKLSPSTMASPHYVNPIHQSAKSRAVELDKTNHQVALPTYCIYRDLVCDGIFHCHAGTDEIPLATLCNPDEGLLNNFLQLGLHASIGIAVCSILFFIALLGLCLCCCYRCCHARNKSPSFGAALAANSPNSHLYFFRPPNVTAGPPGSSSGAAVGGSDCAYPLQPAQSTFFLLPNNGSTQDNCFQLVPSQTGGSDCTWTTSPSGILIPGQTGPNTYSESSVLTGNDSTTGILPQQPSCILLGSPIPTAVPLPSLQPSSNLSALQTLHSGNVVVGGQFYQICPSPYLSLANPDKTSDNASRTSSQSSGLAARANTNHPRGYPLQSAPSYGMACGIAHQPSKNHKVKQSSQNGSSQKSSSRRNTSPSFSSHSSALASQGQSAMPSAHQHYHHHHLHQQLQPQFYNGGGGQFHRDNNISDDKGESLSSFNNRQHHDKNMQCLMQL